ncbi:hypothetical protein TWF730_007432 [Orbilia blumenaviensis]|uniref:Uncharacterized protein n=1 Tax=Orbilia blumenaviensis TaxID=1796055 RepID=A0AAV9V810_9PEZI
MSQMQEHEVITVTRGGEVIVIVPSTKTEPVKNIPHAETSVAQTMSLGVPTTMATLVRSSELPVIIITQVITLTALPTGGDGSMWPSAEETVAFTRAKESRPAGLPFPAGPLATTEGPSPLETGGVHTPQEQFNGLAASPGVIAGTFAALVGVGIILCFGCWIRRKRRERLIKMAGSLPGAAAPVIPQIHRYLQSPVWFGKKLKGKSTELQNLQPAPVGPATAGPSTTAPTPLPTRPKSPREGAIGEVYHMQKDPKRDIMSTEAIIGGHGFSTHRQSDNVTEGQVGKENQASDSNIVGDHMIVVEPDVGYQGSFTYGGAMPTDIQEVPQAVLKYNVPSVPELADTNPFRKSVPPQYGYTDQQDGNAPYMYHQA